MGTLRRMRGTPKDFEPLRQNGYSLPPARGKVPPKGADEGGYRWVRRPSNGRMGTSAPTQGYDRFRRGRCPQRPVDNGCTPVVPLIRHGCAMPPSPLRGEGYSRSVGSAQMSMAFPSFVTANAMPPSPRGRHCAGEKIPGRDGPAPANGVCCELTARSRGRSAPCG